MKKNLFIFTVIFLSSLSNFAQDDLLDELNEETKNETSFELPAFKAMKIGNLQSTKVGAKGDLYLYVSHRFGALKDGFDTFFGLDNANTKIQLAYSFWEGVQLSISRESYNKAVASSVKYRLAKQSSKFPVNLTGYGTVNINTQLEKTNFPNLKSSDRYSYAAQLLVSRRFSDNFSFELAPSYVRQNFQNLNVVQEAKHNQFAMGFGGRLKMSKRVSLNAEYIYNMSRPKNSPFSDAYAFGVDIETGGHIFQLLFTNAQSTNEPAFISAAEGDLFFGFNIVRVF
ncbi:MAG: DUF5777 family beta-barrel protein [Polaribacter sp.]